MLIRIRIIHVWEDDWTFNKKRKENIYSLWNNTIEKNKL